MQPSKPKMEQGSHVMIGKKLIAISAFALASAAPAFAGCEEEIDALSKAVSGPVTMAAGHRAAMMRMAVHGYDQCMAGDPKSFEGIAIKSWLRFVRTWASTRFRGVLFESTACRVAALGSGICYA